jgi:biopolymer transport protein ExbD
MAGGSSYQDEDSGGGMISEINVTPLVDITLVLLIIFMVTAQLIVTRGIKIESPTTRSGAAVTEKKPLVVTIDKERKLLINGERYANDAAIKSYIKQLVAENAKVKDSKPLKAIITADKVVPHGDVMHAIDVVKLSGITRFALTTKRPTAEDEDK